MSRVICTEKDDAIRLANAVLDRPGSCDPDEDIAVLARQFLRSQEALAAMRLTGLREARDLAWNKSRSTMNDIEEGELRAASRINDLIERQS